MPATLVTLPEIFADKILRMPDFQRGYSWAVKNETKQLNDLWNDLQNIEDGSPHFMGIITLEQITEKTKARWENEHPVTDDLKILVGEEKLVPYFVVDGQQRLVSLSILLYLLTKESDISEKNREGLLALLRKQNGDNTCYLFGYEKDTPLTSI